MEKAITIETELCLASS